MLPVLHNEVRTVTSQTEYNAMCFGAWNIRSLAKHFDEFHRALHNSNIECMVTVELWLNDTHDLDNFAIDHYTLFRADRTAASGKMSGGGIMVYVKNGLTCVDMATFTKCTPDIECIWLKLKLTNN